MSRSAGGWGWAAGLYGRSLTEHAESVVERDDQRLAVAGQQRSVQQWTQAGGVRGRAEEDQHRSGRARAASGEARSRRGGGGCARRSRHPVSPVPRAPLSPFSPPPALLPLICHHFILSIITSCIVVLIVGVCNDMKMVSHLVLNFSFFSLLLNL